MSEAVAKGELRPLRNSAYSYFITNSVAIHCVISATRADEDARTGSARCHRAHCLPSRRARNLRQVYSDGGIGRINDIRERLDRTSVLEVEVVRPGYSICRYVAARAKMAA